MPRLVVLHLGFVDWHLPVEWAKGEPRLMSLTDKEHIKTLEAEIAALKQRKTRRSRDDVIRSEAHDFTPTALFTVCLSSNTIVVANKSIQRMTGYPLAEIIDKPLACFDIWVDQAERDRFLSDHKRGQHRTNYEVKLKCKDGARFTGLINSHLIFHEGVSYAFSAVRDITQARETEVRLQQSDARFSTIFENSDVPMLLLRVRDRQVLNINPAAVELVEFDEKLDVGSQIRSTWLDDQASQTFLKELTRAGHCLGFEAFLKSTSGRVIPVQVSGRMLEIDGESCILMHAQNLTALKRTERRARAKTEELELAQEVARFGSFNYDPVKRLLYLSRFLAGVLGLPSGVNKLDFRTFVDLVYPADRPKFLKLAETSENFVFRLENPQNNIEWMRIIYREKYSTSLQCVTYHGVVQDITEYVRAELEREQLQKRILQTQKLESMGVLAGGIAHDFNNLLTSVLGNADLAMVSLDQPLEIKDCLSSIISSAERAAELTSQLLSYSGKGNFLIEKLNLTVLIKNMSQLIKVSISEDVTVEYALDEQLVFFEGDQSQIQQIIMNLIINAYEAMQGQAGVIVISTGVEFDQDYLATDFVDEMPRGTGQVFLSIKDNGVGMDGDVLARLFEPFYSTKFTGRGLGMAAVLGIIRGHQGAVQVNSRSGVGTSFKVLMPVFREKKSVDPESAGSAALAEGRSTLSGK